MTKNRQFNKGGLREKEKERHVRFLFIDSVNMPSLDQFQNSLAAQRLIDSSLWGF